jgi:pyruvate kinase
MIMRKTKIVCTIGPACNSKEMLLKMIAAGMNVARINMSHGTYDELEQVFDTVKSAIKESGKNVAILLDTKGPEVRVGVFKDGSARLKKGKEFSLFKNTVEGDENGVSLSFPKLVDLFFAEGEAAKGRELLLDDGLISLIVKDVTEEKIVCTVREGGVLKSRKSINIPNYHINMPYVSAQDRRDIEFGLNHGANVVAASFVRNHEDVRTLRDFIDSLGYEYVEIIAKIENQSGVDDMDTIIDYADGVMVARGDMGVEIPFIKLPEIQKQLIRKCVAKGKYVITATQMLESMTTAPRPTRAEISDVANAVYDGTSAVMLSAESAAGKYPIESVRALDAICSEAEQNGEFTALHKYIEECGVDDKNTIRGSICKAAKEIAAEIGAKAIVVESATGKVARAMVHFRPEVPVIAVVTSTLVCRKLALNWGVTALVGEEKRTSDSITKQAMDKALSTGLVHKGDTVVVLSSNRTYPTSSTDSLNIRIL